MRLCVNQISLNCVFVMLGLQNQDLIADANCDQATPVETTQVSLPWGLLGLFSAGAVIVFPVTPHC